MINLEGTLPCQHKTASLSKAHSKVQVPAMTLQLHVVYISDAVTILNWSGQDPGKTKYS